MCTMNPNLTSGQRLMAESQHMGVEVKVAADKLDRLEAQNAKLRELLVWAVEVADDYYYCCGAKDDLDAVKNEMRGLGIEVE